jgi:Fe-S-cluster containining protein
MSVHVRGSLRHACTGCGGSCRGVVVRVTPEEAAHIEALAPALGVADPVVEGALRRADGACVFLDDAGRCRVHAAHATTWQTAAPIADGELSASRVEVDAPTRAPEAAVLDLLTAPGATVGRALAALTGQRAVGDAPPPALTACWAAHLARTPLQDTLAGPAYGSTWRAALAPLGAPDLVARAAAAAGG